MSSLDEVDEDEHDVFVNRRTDSKELRVWRAFCETSPITVMLNWLDCKMQPHPIRKLKDHSVNYKTSVNKQKFQAREH